MRVMIRLLAGLLAFRRDKLGFLEHCANQSGDVVPVPIGRPTWLLKDARDVQHVLQTRPERYQKGSNRTSLAGRRVAGTGLLTLTGDAHLARKRLLQPAFAQAAIAPFANAAVDMADERASRWQEHATIDVAAEMAALAQDVATRALFGDLDAGRHDAFVAAIRARRRYIQFWFDYPLPGRDRLPLPVVWRHRRADRVIQSVIHEQIAHRRTSGPSTDLLSLLLTASHAESGGLDDAAVMDEARTMALTGYETVGEALAWTWHLLAGHAAVAKRVHDEVEVILGDRRASAEDYAALRYTRQVVAESLRLYPPTWLFTRTAREDDRLPSGAAIAAGANLFLCPWIVQRRDVYFPDPGRFDPDRFAEGQATWPAFAYFPFGGGRHVCIGQALARTECVLAIATLVRSHRFTPVPGHRVQPDPAITLTPRHALPMIVNRVGSAPRVKATAAAAAPAQRCDLLPIGAPPTHTP